MQSARERRGSALEIPAYRRYLACFTAVSFGEQSHELVRAWLAYELHHSAGEAGIVLLLSAIGQGASAPFGGVIADRVNRKRIIMWTQALMFVTSLLLTLLASLDVVRLWHLLILALAMGIAGGINGPSRQSVVFNIVGPNYVSNALALNYGMLSAMRLAAPLIAGFIIAGMGVGPAFFSSVVAFAVSMVMLRSVVVGLPQKKLEKRESLRFLIREGAAHLYQRKPLFWLFVLCCVGIMLGLPLRTSLSAFASEGLSRGPGVYGILLGVLGLGGLLATVLMTRISNSKNKGSLLIWSGIVSGFMIVTLSQAQYLLIALPILLVIGATQMLYQVVPNIVIQRNVEDAYRGRLLSIQSLSYSLAGGTGLLLGIVIDAAGIRTAFTGLGITLAVFIAAIGAWRKDIHSLG